MPTYQFRYGDRRVPSGYFLPRDVPATAAAAGYEDGAGPAFRHLSTFPGRSTIKEAVLDVLSRATRHVFFANFLIQDADVVEALLAAAARLEGHVYVLTTLKTDDFSAAGGEDGGDFREHIACVERLSARGIVVKARSDCHAKFMTADDEVAVVTSANAVPTCYRAIEASGRARREANPENGVRLTDGPEVRRLANFFRSMWRTGCNYAVTPGSAAFRVEDIQPGHPRISVREPPRPGTDGEVLWTAPEDPRLCDRLVRMARAAKRELVISTWVVKGMTDHPVGAALVDAAARCDTVRLLARGMNHRDDLRDQCYRLTRATGGNLRVVGDYWNHSKAVVADGREALVLSANLDAQHGLDGGVEVGYWSASPDFVRAVEGFLDRLFGEAAFEFVCDPTQSEMAARYGRQKGERLGGELRFRIPPRPGPSVDQRVRRWCQAFERQLVRVARHKHQGRDKILLLTEQTAAFCTPVRPGSFDVTLEDDPGEEVRSRFDSYLGPSDIEVTW
ncbi:MAG: phosphatidylserine/phosphatidylglycerophosphate/cardiolipin synthase family protein [Gemmataceae bacterium]|nr:phosphatidylserine/phosphatidylglycerophosphate/cardiolipin synthase family protein [Gemmataceae bacterium]